MRLSASLRILYFLLSCVIILTTGCDSFRQDSKIEKIELLDLLFETKDMPPHWTIANHGVNKAIDPYRSSDAAGIVFLSDLYPESLGVGQEVYRFRTITAAKDDYTEEHSILTLASYTPKEWSYYSQQAGENFFSCSDAPNFTSCAWLARYDRIVIEVRSVLIPNRFDLEDMEKIVQVIDEKASDLIKNNTVDK